MEPLIPWTRNELISEIKKHGWTRMKGSRAAIYHSPNGTEFQFDAYAPGKGVLWRWYAGRREIPEESHAEHQWQRHV